jgi:hypothetical protein
MSSPPIEVTRVHLRWTFVAVIVATVLYVLAAMNPALNSLSQGAFFLLGAARFILLGSCLALVSGLMIYRFNEPVLLKGAIVDGKFQASPCSLENVWTLDQKAADLPLKRLMSLCPAEDHRKIQVVVLRSLELSETIAALLQQLNNLVVLDVQGSKVPNGFWTDLEKCRNLHHIFANKVLHEADMKEVHMTLPEAKFYLEPCAIVIRGSSSQR